MAKIAVFMADGCEEIEALTVVDLCRRVGIETQTVSISERKLIQGAHDICFLADQVIEAFDFEQMDMLVLPGGKVGTEKLQACKILTEGLVRFHSNNRPIAAICAAPSIFANLGLLEGKTACSHPSFEQRLAGATVVKDPVVLSDNILTSRGLGTAISFALAIVTYLCDEQTAKTLAESIVYA
ncbi:MAG: DJ-1/PfpI family protein, partial [Clostridium sp.]|nr:DJ-1/PfpI family protein [Clostridium sp.]